MPNPKDAPSNLNPEQVALISNFFQKQKEDDVTWMKRALEGMAQMPDPHVEMMRQAIQKKLAEGEEKATPEAVLQDEKEARRKHLADLQARIAESDDDGFPGASGILARFETPLKK